MIRCVEKGAATARVCVTHVQYDGLYGSAIKRWPTACLDASQSVLTWTITTRKALQILTNPLLYLETVNVPKNRPPLLCSGVYVRAEKVRKKTSFSNGQNVSPIRRLICNPEWGGGCTAEGARRLQGAPVIRAGEKYLFSFLVYTNYIISSAAAVARWPSALRNNLRCHLSVQPWQAVTLLGIVGDDSSRPCVLERRFCGNWLVKEVPRQIKSPRLSRLRWFIELRAVDQFLLWTDLFMCPSVLFWWASRINQWENAKEHTNAPSDLT